MPPKQPKKRTLLGGLLWRLGKVRNLLRKKEAEELHSPGIRHATEALALLKQEKIDLEKKVEQIRLADERKTYPGRETARRDDADDIGEAVPDPEESSKLEADRRRIRATLEAVKRKEDEKKKAKDGINARVKELQLKYDNADNEKSVYESFIKTTYTDKYPKGSDFEVDLYGEWVSPETAIRSYRFKINRLERGMKGIHAELMKEYRKTADLERGIAPGTSAKASRATFSPVPDSRARASDRASASFNASRAFDVPRPRARASDRASASSNASRAFDVPRPSARARRATNVARASDRASASSNARRATNVARSSDRGDRGDAFDVFGEDEEYVD